MIERNKDAALTRAQQGYLCGNPCYGWQWEDLAQVAPNGRRRIVSIPKEGECLQQIKSWYESGWTAQHIVRELNQRGVPSPSGRTKWWDTQVYKVLFSPLHTGQVPSAQGWLPGEHYACRYWDMEDLERLEALRERRQTNLRSNTLAADPATHLLAGIVMCARCGKRLYVHGANTIYRNYRCMSGKGQGERSARAC